MALVPDLIMAVALVSDSATLMKITTLSKKINSLCSSEFFWKQRIAHEFPLYFSYFTKDYRQYYYKFLSHIPQLDIENLLTYGETINLIYPVPGIRVSITDSRCPEGYYFTPDLSIMKMFSNFVITNYPRIDSSKPIPVITAPEETSWNDIVHDTFYPRWIVRGDKACVIKKNNRAAMRKLLLQAHRKGYMVLQSSDFLIDVYKSCPEMFDLIWNWKR